MGAVRQAVSASMPIDARIAALAAQQHGVVTAAQLFDLGVGPGGIAHRLRSGRLHPLYRGVYAVGTPLLAREGRWIAAVFACGRGAVLSHRNAAALWRICDPPSGRIHVTVAGRVGRMRRRGIRIHRPVSLRESEVTTRFGIPITTPGRTLLDLASITSASELGRRIRSAEAERVFDLRQVAEVVEAHPRVRGTPRLRAALQRFVPVGETRSELEEMFVSLCAENGLPLPVAGPTICGFEVDFAWPGQRLIVECDGRRHHATLTAFEEDRRRDAVLTGAGWRVIRFTYEQVVHQPEHVLRVLHALLQSREPAGATFR